MTEIKSTPILDIPEIPSGLIDAAQKGKLVFFIGAGVSRILGSPGWQGFAMGYLNYIYEKDCINHREKEYLSTFSARKIISVCRKIIKEEQITLPDYREILKINEGYKKEKEYKIYENLYSCNAIYITTNYDDYLDKISIEQNFHNEKENSGDKKSIFLKRGELLVSNLNNGNVLHIHGSIDDDMNMIETIVDYMEHYRERSEIPELLKEIFNSYTVLFIGYGIEEYEILEFIINKGTIGKDEIRHYMLFPIYKEQESLLKLQENYYKDLGIDLRPYNISDKGFDQLIEVVEEWSEVIKKESQPQNFLDKMKIIDEVI